MCISPSLCFWFWTLHTFLPSTMLASLLTKHLGDQSFVPVARCLVFFILLTREVRNVLNLFFLIIHILCHLEKFPFSIFWVISKMCHAYTISINITAIEIGSWSNLWVKTRVADVMEAHFQIILSHWLRRAPASCGGGSRSSLMLANIGHVAFCDAPSATTLDKRTWLAGHELGTEEECWAVHTPYVAE